MFLQWLDCVHQLWVQFPHAFEYDERVLRFVMQAVLSCRFGTFLFDSERERAAADVRARTVSVWTEVLEGGGDAFRSARYRPPGAAGVLPLRPRTAPGDLTMWAYYGQRWIDATSGDDAHFATPASLRRPNSMHKRALTAPP